VVSMELNGIICFIIAIPIVMVQRYLRGRWRIRMDKKEESVKIYWYNNKPTYDNSGNLLVDEERTLIFYFDDKKEIKKAIKNLEDKLEEGEK
jgi:hypothetical protein|tara:strand:+ start:156 stop:431 length:276 start_codon:yes stop_codon:yes gene_type:complete